MSVYVYAIARGAPEPPNTAGLAGARVEMLAADRLAAAYSWLEGREVDASADALWAHEAVVDELMRTTTVLPLRFGTMVDGTAALEALLTDRHAHFVALLDRVAGCVELAVRVAVQDAPDSQGGDGRDYLAAKLSARRAADAVLVPLAAAAAAVRRTPARGGGVAASYLVAREGVGEFAEEVRALRESHPELDLSCTGPWAPYSFVAEEVR